MQLSLRDSDASANLIRITIHAEPCDSLRLSNRPVHLAEAYADIIALHLRLYEPRLLIHGYTGIMRQALIYGFIACKLDRFKLLVRMLHLLVLEACVRACMCLRANQSTQSCVCV